MSIFSSFLHHAIPAIPEEHLTSSKVSSLISTLFPGATSATSSNVFSVVLKHVADWLANDALRMTDQESAALAKSWGITPEQIKEIEGVFLERALSRLASLITHEIGPESGMIRANPPQ